MSAIQSVLAGYKGAAGGGSAIALIANAAATSNINTNTTSAIDTTGATLLIAHISYVHSVSMTVSDSKSNTWTPLTEYNLSGGGDGRLYYCIGGTVGSGHTFTCAGTASYNTICVAAFSLVGAIDGAGTGGGNASTVDIQPGSITPAANDSLLVTGVLFVATSGVPTINSGFTVINSTVDVDCFAGGIAYKVQTTAGAENPLWTSPASANRMVAEMAAFSHV